MALMKKKGTTGAVTNYISRKQALKKLQISLKDFRRLCILKGIYPRDPPNKKKINKGSSAPNTWYYRKDVMYLLHEPLLQKFRDWKIFARKMARVMAKGNYSAADSLEENKPQFTIDHIIRERYPTFTDALRDLDDALSMVFLFASMPSTSAVKGDLVAACQRKAVEFMQYVVQTRALRKTFISIKGIYYQAEIKGQAITWVTPHQFSQEPPSDVDFKVMGTFLHLYDTLLGFVLFKLYTDANLKYPPTVNEALEKDGAGLAALMLEAKDAAAAAMATSKAAAAAAPAKLTAEEKKRIQTLKAKIASIKADEGAAAATAEEEEDASSAPMEVDEEKPAEGDEFRAAAEAAGTTGDATDILSRPLVTYTQLAQSLTAQQSLFASLVFYVSREVPRTALEFLIRSFGGQVGWDAVLGAGSPIAESDPRITHHLVDRPAVTSAMQALPRRTFVQPQWVFDCVNAGKLLLVSGSTTHGEGYAPGMALPPHLSPFEEKSDLVYDPTANYDDDAEAEAAAAHEDALALADSDEEDNDDGVVADSDDDAEEMSALDAQRAAAQAAKIAKQKQAQEEADKLAMAKILMSNRNKKTFENLQRKEGRQRDEMDKLKTKKAKMAQQAAAPRKAPASKKAGKKF
ncbi:mRNA-binding ribosome synthesis protein nop7 [Blastocladiella emersonii ATCC 22665]|nr:mRNA-binding ribosome synthesis protein nop7 [Blastocladiella emersonii ATCC 22665]